VDVSFENISVTNDPLDLVEYILTAEEVGFERIGEQEIHFSVPGQWCDYPLWFAWRPENEVLHLCLGIDAKVKQRRRADVCDLLVRINERLASGHFDLWSEDGTIIYRHALPLPDTTLPTPGQLAAMTNAASAAAERLIPALNFVLWAGKTPSEAVEAALFETAGEA
jgi:hypothetical protein